mmetsp:Transcript_1853/g.8248  ORF Transcript_1853/g.8248 Transcript_1853/m.8248 type:complete len:248 (-) Transcript_1853:911-1654(-)
MQRADESTPSQLHARSLLDFLFDFSFRNFDGGHPSGLGLQHTPEVHLGVVLFEALDPFYHFRKMQAPLWIVPEHLLEEVDNFCRHVRDVKMGYPHGEVPVDGHKPELLVVRRRMPPESGLRHHHVHRAGHGIQVVRKAIVRVAREVLGRQVPNLSSPSQRVVHRRVVSGLRIPRSQARHSKIDCDASAIVDHKVLWTEVMVHESKSPKVLQALEHIAPVLEADRQVQELVAGHLEKLPAFAIWHDRV